MNSKVQKLHEVIRSWGGELRNVSLEEYERVQDGSRKLYEAPFTLKRLGILWSRKTIFFVGEADIGDLIHEAGHTFATRVNPERSWEWDFFGWEHALARMLRVETDWMRAHHEYLTMESEAFGTLPSSERCKLLKDRQEFAVSTGLVQDGKPFRFANFAK